MLSEREKLNLDVHKILDAQTVSWGGKVTNVEIKHIDLNESMVRAIAHQREGDRLHLDAPKTLPGQTASCGVQVTNVEINHIDLIESMVLAIARQPVAEREWRSKVIHAEGELQAAQALADEANVLSEHPA